MQWWCSAQGLAWSWTWRPYLGVWVVVAAAAWLLSRAARHAPASQRGRARTAALVAAVALLWITLDWPVGTLGAGYLVWVHTAQFLSLALVVPPLVLLGLPHEALAAAVGTGRLRRLWRAAVEPFVALVLFNVLVVVTHLPPTVDWLMVSQLGSFALDAAWLAGGLIFWWPLIAPQSGSAPLGPVARIGYLLLSSFIHMGVGIVLVVSRFPLYRVYELAPPVGVLKLDDQQLAGGVMLIVGSLIIATALFILLRQWLLHEEAVTAGGGRVSIPPEIHLP